jgi:hypothetical protein
VISLVDSVAPADGFPYRALVLPYLPLTLEALINEAAVQRMGEAAARGALPVPAYTTWEVCWWVAMMADGLAFLRFGCRISHGDLAPRNVLIAGGPNKDGVVSWVSTHIDWPWECSAGLVVLWHPSTTAAAD